MTALASPRRAGIGRIALNCIGLAAGIGVFNAYMTTFEQIIEPYGYTTDDAGLASAALIGTANVLGNRLWRPFRSRLLDLLF
jgi:hypothetical protein